MSKVLVPDFVQGDNLKITITTRPPINLIGSEVRLVLKKTEGTTIHDLDILHIGNDTVDQDTGYNAGLGTVVLFLTSEDTNIPPNSYLAFLSITQDNKTTTLRSGKDDVSVVKVYKAAGA